MSKQQPRTRRRRTKPVIVHSDVDCEPLCPEYPLVGQSTVVISRNGRHEVIKYKRPGFLPLGWASDKFPIDDSLAAIGQWLSYHIEVVGPAIEELYRREPPREDRPDHQFTQIVQDAYRLVDLLVTDWPSNLPAEPDGPLDVHQMILVLKRVRQWFKSKGKSAAKLGVSANNLEVSFDDRVPHDVRHMAEALAENPTISKRKASRIAAEKTKGSDGSIYGRFDRLWKASAIRFVPELPVRAANSKR